MELRGFLSCCEQLPVEWTCSLPHVHYLTEGSVPFLFFSRGGDFLRQWMEVVSVFGNCGKQVSKTRRGRRNRRVLESLWDSICVRV